MSLFDSDIVQRGYVQHRRAITAGAGAPRANQILEGEIAINLATRKLYSKRPTRKPTPININITSAPVTTAGYRLTISNIFASSERKVGFTVNGNQRSVTISPSTTVDSFINGVEPIFTNELGQTPVIDSDNVNINSSTKSVLFWSPTEDVNFSVDSEFTKYIDYSLEEITRLQLQSNLAPKTPKRTYSSRILFDVVQVVGTDKISVATGQYVHNENKNLFLTNFTGNNFVYNTNNTYQLLERTKSGEEVFELSNIPTQGPTLPDNASTSVASLQTAASNVLSTGSLFIKRGINPDNNAADAGALHWLDTSTFSSDNGKVDVNSDHLQDKFRGMTPSARAAANLVFFDSDGLNGLPRYAEWRVVDSASNVRQASTASISGVRTYTNNIFFEKGAHIHSNLIVDSDFTVKGSIRGNGRGVIFDSDLIVNRNLNVDGNTVIGNSANDKHTINGNVDINHNLNVDGNTVIGNSANDKHTINGNVDINHNLNVDGNTVFNSDVTIQDGSTFTFNNTPFRNARPFTIFAPNGTTIINKFWVLDTNNSPTT